MQANLIHRWVEALRGGDHEPIAHGSAKDCLRYGRQFGPLGILLDLVAPEGWEAQGENIWRHEGWMLPYSDRIRSLVPPEWTRIGEGSFGRLAFAAAADRIERDLPRWWQRRRLRKLGEAEPNHLRGSTAYLCGPIDACPEGGKHWRERLKPSLASLGIRTYDPLDKPLDIGLEDDDARRRRARLKQEGGYDELAAIMRSVRAADLRMVDKADFVVCYLDLDAAPCGTYEELFLANRHKHPVVLWCPQGKHRVPDWLFGTIPHGAFCSTEDEVRRHLHRVARRGADGTRWQFFRPDGPV